MSSRPYVTALIDTYNQGRFIEEGYDRILNWVGEDEADLRAMYGDQEVKVEAAALPGSASRGKRV